MSRKFIGTGLALGLLFVFSSGAFAQQTTSPQDGGQQQRMERRGKHRGMGRRGGVQRLAGELNLTDTQQQQLRAIEERFEASTKSQREEMRRLHESNQNGTLSTDAESRAEALRAELGQARRNMHQEMMSVLTQEQRTQFEQLIKERKARHGERRGRFSNQQNDEQ
ncbi:MAG TPA: Spy/CpxP family protein refolding chaperone [Pyrinomonadaceae bacterium]|nr:Spy/CpxP family protein refolding chaperone [Pyrinomonadaceae bacterium]